MIMKKLILKYLPIPLALLVALACSLTLSHYEKNRFEYAMVSYSSNAISLDISVSLTGRIVKVVPADDKSSDEVDTMRFDDMHVSDLLLNLSALAEEGETVFVGVYVIEESEIECEELKPILKEATSKLEVSHLGAYGYYSGYDTKRAISYKKPIGRMAFSTFYGDTFYDELGEYVDSYLTYGVDPFELALYAEFMFDQHDDVNVEEVLRMDLSGVKTETPKIDKATAEKLALDHVKSSTENENANVYFSGYYFTDCNLNYCFEFEYGSDSMYALVDLSDGTVTEHYAEDIG